MMMRRVLPAAFLATIACGSPAPPAQVAVPATTTSTPVASTSVAPPPVPPREAKPIAIAGENVVQNAAWIEKGFLAAVTRTAVWRVRPESPQLVTITPLAAPLANDAVITGAPNSSIVAAALADGTVEIQDEKGHRHTLPAPATKIDSVLDLKLSPDAKVLAVNRDGPTWKEETTLYDVTTGAVLGKVDGGNVVFDPSSKYVAARGGVASLDGKLIKEWKEGFYVLGGGGRLVPIDRAGGGEVMAGDYVARAWFKGQAVYAGDQTVELIDPATGASTPIDAKCGAKKISTAADVEHGRMIGVCEDAVLITDLDARTTKRVAASVQKGGMHWAIDVYVSTDGSAIGFTAGRNEILIRNGVLQSGSVRAEIETLMVNSPTAHCLHPDTPRKAIKCSVPSKRGDGAFSAHLANGLDVVTPAGRNVIDWHSAGTGLPRQPRPPISPTGCGAPPAGTKEWSAEVGEDMTAYTAVKVANSRVAAHVVCVCSANGCVKSEIAGFADTPLAFRSDGSVLTADVNSTMTAATLTLRRPKKPPVIAKLTGDCRPARFAPDGRLFILCETNHEGTLYELGANDLAVVGKRTAPPIYMTDLEVRNGELLLESGDVAMVVPLDWVKDATVSERARIYSVFSSTVTIARDGKIDVQGDPQAANHLLRCFDGTHLRPYETCR